MSPDSMDRVTENKNVLKATAVSLSIHAAVVIMLLAVTSNPVPRLLESGDAGYIMVSLVTGETGTSEAGPVFSSPRQRRAVPPEEKKRVIPAAEKSSPVERRETPPVRLAILGNLGHGASPPSVAISYPSDSGGVEGLAVHAVNGGAGGAGEGASSGGRKVSLAIPKYRENVHPRYPMLARSRGEEGVVLVSAEVLANGKVGGLRIKKTSGYRLLDQSALEAVKNWKFEPARRMGIPFAVWVEIPVRFALRDSEG
jgi:TonB family protein